MSLRCTPRLNDRKSPWFELNFPLLLRRENPSKNNHLSSVPLANPPVPEASPPGMELGTSVLAIGTRGMESGTSVLSFGTPGMLSGTAVLRKSPSGMKPGTVENHDESSGFFKGLWHKALVWVLNQRDWEALEHIFLLLNRFKPACRRGPA